MKRILSMAGMALLTGLLILTGCSNPLTGKPETGDLGENRGLVRIQVGSPARTLQPVLTDFSKYEVDFAGSAGAKHDQVVLTSGTGTVELSPGDWTITVAAYGTGDTAVKAAEGSAAVTVTSGGTVNAAITLAPYTGGGGGGNLTYTITHPAGLDSATLIITQGEGEALATINLLETGKNPGIHPLDAGSYRVQARLVQGDLTAGKTESLHIYPTLNTPLNYTFTHADFVAFAEVDPVTVSGTAQLDDGGVAVDAEVRITLYNVGSAGVLTTDDLSGWFTNLPAGLSAAAKAGIAEGGREITVTISGTPTEASSAELEIAIPGEALDSGEALTVRSNPEAKFAIGLPAASAAVADVTLTGEAGRLLNGEVVITLTNETFQGITQSQDLSAWFTGLPSALNAAAKNAPASNNKTLTITVTGTPTAVLASQTLNITIPGTSLSRGSDLEVTGNAALTVNENTMTGVYLVGTIGESPAYSGKYWKYSKTGSFISDQTLGGGETEVGQYSYLAISGDDLYLVGTYTPDAAEEFYGEWRLEKNGTPVPLQLNPDGMGMLYMALIYLATAPDGTVYGARLGLPFGESIQYWEITGEAPQFRDINPGEMQIIIGIAVDDTHIYIAGYIDDTETLWKCSRTTADIQAITIGSHTDYGISGIAESGDYVYLAGSQKQADQTYRAVYWKVNKSTQAVQMEVLTAEYESNAYAITVSEDDLHITGHWKRPQESNKYYGASAAYWKVSGSDQVSFYKITDRTDYQQQVHSSIYDSGSAIAVDGGDVYIGGKVATVSGRTPLWKPVYWKFTDGNAPGDPIILEDPATTWGAVTGILVR